MTTLQNGDSFLVQRTDSQSGISTNYQVSQENLMANLADDDLLLVQRTSAGISTNYCISGSDLKEDLGGPDGLIVPPVSVLTPLNGAGLNDGQSYTPMSSAYVSTDTTPIYQRHFPELITTVSGGSWVDENKMFNGSQSYFSELTGAAGVVSQAVFTPQTGWTEAQTTVWAYVTTGGTVEVLDETDTVLRSYALLTSFQEVGNDIGIVRANQKIRFTTNNQNESLFISRIFGAPTDYIINDRVAFEFADDTDLDKMVAPITMTDANGDVKIPTTSTVDSTTSIPGENKSFYENFGGNGSTKTFTSGTDGSGNYYAPVGTRMTWAKAPNAYPGIISDNVNLYGKCLETDSAQGINNMGPLLDENQSQYTNDVRWNNNGTNNFIAEIGVAPKVLDIVSWTGDGVSMREIPHNLGTKPGMIIVKQLTTWASYNWYVWHIDLQPNHNLNLDWYNGQNPSSLYFPSEPTKDAFYVGNGAGVNNPGIDYVAYVFAADTPGKVKCGTYQGTGSTQDIDCGFDYSSGFVLIKRIDGPNTNWVLSTSKMSSYNTYWAVNTRDMFGHTGMKIDNSATTGGFRLIGTDTDFNQSGGTYVYLALDKFLTGPQSTQLNLLSGQDLEYFTTGTQITSNASASGDKISYTSATYGGNGSIGQTLTPYVGSDRTWLDLTPDGGNKWMVWTKSYTAAFDHALFDSERDYYSSLPSNSSNGEVYSPSTFILPYNDGSAAGFSMGNGAQVNFSGQNYIAWNFVGAPQFLDIQKYVGNGGYQTIQHDLGVEPGFIIVKSLGSSDWICYHSELGANWFLELNNSSAAANGSNRVRGATDADFEVGPLATVNTAGQDYVAYIFAKDTPYVKCGKYNGSGNGTSVNVGFKPRWVMIKNITGSFDWMILDKNIPSNKTLSPNTSSQSVALANGYQFTSNGFSFGGTDWESNYSGEEYIYVAIADESEGHPPNFPASSTVTETPDPATAQMVVNAESFDVGATASAPALEASITSVAGSDGNKLLVDGSTGTWMPGLYAKGSETTINAPGPDEITFTSQNQGTPAFSGVDATLASRTWTLESGATATGPWTVVDTYVDYDVLNSQDGSTPWSSNKPNLTPNTFYRVKVQYDSTNAESVESVYNTFKTGDA